jgi:O-antigen/teichoic acid export membrane protein
MTNEPANHSDAQRPEHEFVNLKTKSLSGMASLLKRQVLGSGIMFLGNIILARILVPQVFGIYAIVAFVVQFFSVFSDVGIGAALIQKKERLNDEEVSTLFWLQQMLALTFAAIVFVVAPLALRIYPSLPPVSVWLIRSLAMTFLFASLKTVPAILMERNLDFGRIAIIEIAEAFTFQATAIVLALVGFEVWSFIIAALCRGFIGAALIYTLSPWRPSWLYHPGSIKELLHFGIPYQGTSILSFIKDAVTPLFVGAYAGAAAVGYINWARDFAFAPLALSQSFGRVAFPAFARLQHERILLKEAIERSIRMITIVMFPITAVMIALAPDVIRIVFTDKWLPGIRAFYFYCTSPLVIGIMLPLYSGIVSLGKSGMLMKMAILLLFLEWGLGVPLVLMFGFTGIAYNQPIIAGIFLFVYKKILFREDVGVVIGKNILYQGYAALLTGVAIKFLRMLVPSNLIMLILLTLAGGVLFLCLLYFFRKAIVQEFRMYLFEVLKFA